LVVSDFPEEWNSHFGRLVQMATDSEGKSYKYVGSNPILITIQFNKLMKFCPIKTETLRRSSQCMSSAKHSLRSKSSLTSDKCDTLDSYKY
jgi:hypothetical protein